MNELEVRPDEKEAANAIRLWCKEHKARICHWYSKTYWEYTQPPFWAFVIKLYSWDAPYWGVYGFHVRNTKVECLGKMPGYDKEG